MAYKYDKKRNLGEAQTDVDSYVEPRDCFVWYINNAYGWQSFSRTKDTPCAHYVAHQLGLTATNGVTCKSGYLVRVIDVLDRLGDPIETETVSEGDVWARVKGTKGSAGDNEPSSHCGMVVKVIRTVGEPPKITIKHCSSGQRKVAENDWAQWFRSGGQFYRLPAREQTAETHANRQRLISGFGYRTPFA
jgi:hypothetical protein